MPNAAFIPCAAAAVTVVIGNHRHHRHSPRAPCRIGRRSPCGPRARPCVRPFLGSTTITTKRRREMENNEMNMWKRNADDFAATIFVTKRFPLALRCASVCRHAFYSSALCCAILFGASAIPLNWKRTNTRSTPHHGPCAPSRLDYASSILDVVYAIHARINTFSSRLRRKYAIVLVHFDRFHVRTQTQILHNGESRRRRLRKSKLAWRRYI